MNTKLMSRAALAAAALAFLCPIGSSAMVLAGSCLKPGSSKAPAQIDIVLNKEDGNTPEFENSFGCDNGAGNPGKGNICLALNLRPDMKFHLKGEAAQKWEFVEFQLSGDNQNWPGDLPLGVYSDFEFDSDTGLHTGKPYVVINGAENMMTVQNNNCHEFNVYYRITLKSNDTPPVWYRLHPVIQNHGTNNN